MIDQTGRRVQHGRKVRVGSTASVERSRHVAFTPDSGRMATTQLNDASGQEPPLALQKRLGDLGP
jgi:hypothetical protein